MPKLLTVKDLCDQLQCSDWLIRDLLKKGVLKGYKTHAGWRVKEADLEAYLKRCEPYVAQRKIYAIK